MGSDADSLQARDRTQPGVRRADGVSSTQANDSPAPVHILLVEDDPLLVESTRRALQSQGWAVDATARGEQLALQTTVGRQLLSMVLLPESGLSRTPP